MSILSLMYDKRDCATPPPLRIISAEAMEVNYQDYKDARDASWRILIDCKVTELPVRISGVCRSLGVSVRRYTPAERDNNDGMSTVVGGAPTIMVSSLAIPARQRFTCAHELGHIILGHVASMISCAASQIRATIPSSRRPTCLPRACLPRPVCYGGAACSRLRTLSGCATSAERLPISGGAGCRSFTGGSAF